MSCKILMTSYGTNTDMGQGSHIGQRSDVDQRSQISETLNKEPAGSHTGQRLDTDPRSPNIETLDKGHRSYTGQRSDEGHESKTSQDSDNSVLLVLEKKEEKNADSDMSDIEQSLQSCNTCSSLSSESTGAPSMLSTSSNDTSQSSNVLSALVSSNDTSQSSNVLSALVSSNDTSQSSNVLSTLVSSNDTSQSSNVLSALVSSNDTSQSSNVLSTLVSSNGTDFTTSSSSSSNSIIVESLKCLKDENTAITDSKLLRYIDHLMHCLRECKDNPLKKIQVMDEIIHGKFIVVCERLFKHLVNTDISSLVPPASSWSQLKKLLSLVWIFSDGSITLCEEMLCSTLTTLSVLLQRLTTSCDLEKNDAPKYVVKALLGILHNINRHLCGTEVRDLLRGAGIMTSVRSLSHCSVPMIQGKAMLVMSYIIDESEIIILSTVDDSAMKFITEVLQDAYQSKKHFSTKFGMSVEETLRGLNNLAINDKNKVCIFNLGILHIYVSLILEYGNPDEVFQAVSGVWRLAFHVDNRPGIRSHPRCIEALMSLQRSDDEAIRHAARGALWELREIPDLRLRPDIANLAVQCPHVMVSYQWDSQTLVLQLKDTLKHAGYKVWMDVEHMTGSTLEAMALAVERSAVILVCMSQKYKDSPSCRSEAEYTYKLRKSFIPICVQENYVADGWLGMLIGTKLYFDISNENLLHHQMPNLMKELGDRGKLDIQTDSIDGEICTPGYVAKLTSVRQVIPSYSDWTVQRVADWAGNLSLTSIPQMLLELDGPLLWEMKKMLESSPDFLYTYLNNSLHMTLADLLKLSRALRQL